jgi:hypothetical protein
MGRPHEVNATRPLHLAALPLLAALAACSATPPAALPPNLSAKGDPAVSGYQQETWVYDRVIITYDKQPALAARLRLLDRGAALDGRIGDRDVSGTCSTFNGFTLELDCRICAAGTEEQACRNSSEPIAHLRIPLH